MLGLHWVDIVVIIAYFLFMAGIGVFAYLRVKNQGDYFMGGRRFGKLMMTMFAFGSGTHADTAVGVAAKSYNVRLAGIWYQWQQLFTTAFYWLIKRLCTIPWALVGVLGMALYSGQGIEADHVFGQAIRDFLPVGLVGLMVACVMASVMSTCDVMIISSSG